MDVVVELGQRAVIGKVAMDQHSPGFYVDQGAEASLAGTRQLVDYIQVCVCVWGGVRRVRGSPAAQVTGAAVGSCSGSQACRQGCLTSTASQQLQQQAC